MITWIVASSIGAVGNILGITLPCCCEKLAFEYELRNSPQPINEEEAEYENKNNNEKENPFVEEIYCNSGRVVPESMSQSVVNIDDEQGYENDINIQRLGNDGPAEVNQEQNDNNIIIEKENIPQESRE